MAITTPFPGGGFLTSGPAGTDGRDGVDGGRGADGANGQDGRDGRDGRDGAGLINTRTARTRILPGSAIVPDGEFYAVPADIYNPAHRGLVIGVTVAGADVNQIVTYQNGGDLDGVAGDFGAGDILFPAADGTLTRTAPTSAPGRRAWRQSVGKASTTSHMVVNLGPAYDLPEAASLLVVPGSDAIARILIAALTPDVLLQSLTTDVFRQVYAQMVAGLPALPSDDAIPDAGGTYATGGQAIVVPPKS